MAKMRGAIRSPGFRLLRAGAFRPPVTAPPQFSVVPSRLSKWGNDQYGDCVTAEEAYAKAAYALMVGRTELIVSDAEVIRWASRYGVLDGATLVEVMDHMRSDGFNVDSSNYKDGQSFSVDYSNPSVLQAAISVGTVKIAIDANALPPAAGDQNGWFSFLRGRFANTDHCVSLTGYGSAAYCFQALGLSVPAGVDPNSPLCFLLFTWGTIGVVSHDWLMGTCVEAWLRNPTTPGYDPQPGPDPGPGPGPGPSSGVTVSGMVPALPFTVRMRGPFGHEYEGAGSTVPTPITLAGPAPVGAGLGIPPFILPFLRALCVLSPTLNLPEPWKTLVATVCGVLKDPPHRCC